MHICHTTQEHPSAGGWGFGLAAIWLADAAQLPQARALIAAYQTERQRRVRAEYEQAARRRNVMAMVKRAPLKAAFFLAAALVVLYLSLAPFLTLMQ